MFRLTYTLIFTLVTFASPAFCGSITFTLVGTATGALNGTGFSNAPFSLTSVADTSLVTRVNTTVELQATTSSIAIAGLPTATFTGITAWGVPQGAGDIIFGNGPTISSGYFGITKLFVGLETYDLVSSIGPIFSAVDFETSFFHNLQNVPTDQGPLTVSASSNETFRAVTAGGLQSVPLLPSSTGPSGQFIYSNVASGLWFDPPTTSAFTYTMTSNSLFTSILDFPTGFTSPFVVSEGGVTLGSFTAGDSMVFPNGGVSTFTISGINPLVDPNNSAAFPLELAFNTTTASFTQQAVPEPEALALVGAGLILLAVRRSARSRIAR